MRERVRLLDTLIDKSDWPGVVDQVHAFVQSGRPHQVVTVNVDFLRLGSIDASFRHLINTADLAVPDGMPLIWASRLLGNALPERITGVELILQCAKLAAEHDYSMYFLGAGPGVAESVAETLRQRYPSLRVVGTYAPDAPFTPDEDAQIVRHIQEASPDMLFVAFGAPKQDQWIRTYLGTMGVPMCVGIGGALDMIAGRVKRAPDWMQASGFEWLFRVTREPRRLWKRYFVHDLPVFCRLMLQSRAAGVWMDDEGWAPADDAAYPLPAYTRDSALALTTLNVPAPTLRSSVLANAE